MQQPRANYLSLKVLISASKTSLFVLNTLLLFSTHDYALCSRMTFQMETLYNSLAESAGKKGVNKKICSEFVLFQFSVLPLKEPIYEGSASRKWVNLEPYSLFHSKTREYFNSTFVILQIHGFAIFRIQEVAF
ncbi:hypothetical protein CEXT_325301 [Caerostris extrusa]|uniref:Secreted protein n=1 Tax=Caerostris extrusa TaxID=172846 RepID=A0AAV4NM98_CAEEX|nr:hypothetical protein CEXT_325301 [Caerostris extrusa]